jgi:hypothetical protein
MTLVTETPLEALGAPSTARQVPTSKCLLSSTQLGDSVGPRAIKNIDFSKQFQPYAAQAAESAIWK